MQQTVLIASSSLSFQNRLKKVRLSTGNSPWTELNSDIGFIYNSTRTTLAISQYRQLSFGPSNCLFLCAVEFNPICVSFGSVCVKPFLHQPFPGVQCLLYLCPTAQCWHGKNGIKRTERIQKLTVLLQVLRMLVLAFLGTIESLKCFGES